MLRCLSAYAYRLCRAPQEKIAIGSRSETDELIFDAGCRGDR